MKMLRVPLFLVAVVSLLVTGCSSYRPSGVSISVVDFRPTDATLLESRGILTVRYVNESISPLGYSGSSHKLYLNGKYIGKGVSSQPFGLPPMNTITQEIPVHLENVQLVQQLIAVRDSQTVAYRLESALSQTIYEDTFEVKLHAEGALELRSLTAPAK